MSERVKRQTTEQSTLPYRAGEFGEVAHELDELAGVAEQLTWSGRPSVTVQLMATAMRDGAAALRRADSLLSPARPEPASESEPPAGEAPPGAVEHAQYAVGDRGDWRGHVGRQPEYSRIRDGRLRGVFFLAQHPDPENRDRTTWIRCYSLGRHAEALQGKGRLAGAEVVVHGEWQGVRQVPQRDGSTREQATLYCYGVRMLREPKGQRNPSG